MYKILKKRVRSLILREAYKSMDTINDNALTDKANSIVMSTKWWSDAFSERELSDLGEIDHSTFNIKNRENILAALKGKLDV